MALNDRQGRVVAVGSWLYDSAVPKRIVVIARNYDIEYSMYQADGLLLEGELPKQPGPDGLYYYVSGSGPFRSVHEAKEWASKSWGPVDWDD